MRRPIVKVAALSLLALLLTLFTCWGVLSFGFRLYRLRGRREDARRLFLEYMREINSLQRQPRFYNTLTTNCTTSIWLNARVNPEHAPFSWKILLSGYLPEYLYEHGRLDTTESFAELQRRSLINPTAMAADRNADFSQRIRASLPAMPLN